MIIRIKTVFSVEGRFTARPPKKPAFCRFFLMWNYLVSYNQINEAERSCSGYNSV